METTTTTPTIDSVEVTSTPMLETDTYGASEDIEFTVTFDEAVNVAGDPVFRYALGNSGAAEAKDAAYASGSGSTALVFSYTVLSSDMDDNGIYLYDGTELSNPDGPVRARFRRFYRRRRGRHHRATSTGPAAGGTQSGHKVDGSQTPGNTPTAPGKPPVLVSNIAESHSGNVNINSPDLELFGRPLPEKRAAQRFTTGPDAAGYLLQSVVLNLSPNVDSGPVVVNVAIHEDNSSGNPGTLLVVAQQSRRPYWRRHRHGRQPDVFGCEPPLTRGQYAILGLGQQHWYQFRLQYCPY